MDGKFIDWEMVTKSLVNAKKITIGHRTHFGHIFSLLRHLPKLTEIRVRFSMNKGANKMNVQELNNERKKLAGASKVVIYVDEFDYLASKWTGGNTDKDNALVQIKRNALNCMFRDDPFIY